MIIKQIPEDFVVEEVIKLNLIKERSNYLIYRLTKKNWDMFKLISTLSRILKTKNKFIGYAGNKDKAAVTTQYISFYKINKERTDNIKIHDVRLDFLGYSKKRINLGDLEGNNFKIKIRDLNNKSNLPNYLYLENYFGEQRFGNKQNTYLVGKAIIKKDFKKACELLNMQVSNNDFIGELRKQPRRLLRFYISSYQAYLWNKILEFNLRKIKNNIKIKSGNQELVIVKDKINNFDIPLISFDAKLTNEIKSLLNEEDISLKDFIIPQMPELITQTSFRKAFIEVKDIQYKYSSDEINKRKLKLEVQFFLPKGSYATILLKKLETYLN